MGELDGKVAVITGAGSGMGKASAEVFVREGAKVVAADITGRQDETAAKLGAVGAPRQVRRQLRGRRRSAVRRRPRGVRTASMPCSTSPGSAASRCWPTSPSRSTTRVFGVNLKGVLLGTKHGIKAMLPTGGGSIVNWSSIGGLGASAGHQLSYSAAKAGIVSFTKSAAVEYGTEGIRANAVCPGFVETPLTGGPGPGERFIPSCIDASAALKRAGQSHEVAEVGAFLASDRASFVTGAVIPVNGGWSAKLA